MKDPPDRVGYLIGELSEDTRHRDPRAESKRVVCVSIWGGGYHKKKTIKKTACTSHDKRRTRVVLRNTVTVPPCLFRTYGWSTMS